MKIMIAIPAYRGIVCPQFIDSLEDTGVLFKDKGLDFFVSVLTGCCYIQIARNKLVKEFLDSDADKILFLDDDISWDAEDAYKLVTSNNDISCGVYRLKTEKEEYPAVLVADKNGVANIVNECIEAVRVPTGFLCITKSVFKTLSEINPHLKYTEIQRGSESFEKIDYIDFFPQGVKNGEWVGEDYALCDLCCEAQYKIQVYPNMTFCHYSQDMSYDGNFYKFLKKHTDDKGI